MSFSFDGVENIVGKGENACYQHFLFTTMSSKRLLFQDRLKSGLCLKEIKKWFTFQNWPEYLS